MKENYFGIPDASSPEEQASILKNYTTRDYDSKLKSFNNKAGKQTIVGIKGSGKTCIRTYIEEKDKKQLFFNLNADKAYLTIDAADFKERSGRLKNVIALEILRCFTSILAKKTTNKTLTSKLKSSLSSALSATTSVLSNIPDAIDVKTPIGTVKLKELFKANSKPIVQNALDELLANILDALGNKKAYIIIDDAEDVFNNLEQNADFIEGLVRAVNDINNVAKNKLHVLLFLKYGIYRYWFENQKEYDKVRHIIQIISWDHEKLCELIALRIANIRKQDYNNNSEELWSMEFKWDKSKGFDNFSNDITKMCVCGPRDIILICNLAKEKAGENKISMSHIDSVLKEYSESQVNEIGANFDDVYPDIKEFVERVFPKVPKELSGKDLAKWIDEKALTNKRVDKQFDKFSWYSDSGKERIVNLMYKIGFIGIHKDSEIVYSIKNPNVNTEELLNSKLVIHPAFRPHLGIEL